MRRAELKHWTIYDGDVRLWQDGTVQHLDDDRWRAGWGPWPPYAVGEIPPRADPDRAAVLAWSEAVREYRSRVPGASDGAVVIGVIPGDYVVRKVGDHMFGVRVFDRCDAGELANGARGYEAGVEIYRDGARVGSGRWDVEGFDDCTDLDGRPLDLGDGEPAIWEALAELVREHLGYRDVPAASGLALAL